MPFNTVRWGDQVAVEVIRGVPYRMYTERPRRVESLLAFTERWSGRPHLIHDGRVLEFDALRRAVANKAGELTGSGVKRGERLFLLGWNSPEWVVNFWACLHAGAIPVLANAWWSEAEIARGLASLQPVLTLADPAAAAKMPAHAPRGEWTFRESGTADVPAPSSTPASASEEDVALIIFTSGTAGRPKAVVLTHRAVLARLQMTLHVTRKLPQQVTESARDTTLMTGPLFHVGAMATLLRALVVGETMVLSRGRFDPVDVMDLIEHHQINRWNAVPTMVSRLLDCPDLAKRDLSSLRSISIGGAPVHAELLQRIRSGLPGVSPRIPTGYGLTENGGQATAAAGSDRADSLGSSGRPLPCVEVKFLAHPGLPDGEILLRSPAQMLGYYGLHESPIDKDGWLHTGDLGRLDERGELWITGRCKDMIIRGGENIAPAAIEAALLAVPGVSDAVAFGVPHPDLGEEVMAVVVVRDDLAPEQLREQLRGKLASFAVPSRWQVQREPLPTNHTGKVDKSAISATVRAAMTAQLGRVTR